VRWRLRKLAEFLDYDPGETVIVDKRLRRKRPAPRGGVVPEQECGKRGRPLSAGPFDPAEDQGAGKNGDHHHGKIEARAGAGVDGEGNGKRACRQAEPAPPELAFSQDGAKCRDQQPEDQEFSSAGEVVRVKEVVRVDFVIDGVAVRIDFEMIAILTGQAMRRK